jgi:hypothetical protein
MQNAEWDAACDLWEQIRQEKPDNIPSHIRGINALIRAYRFEEADRLESQLQEMAEGRFGVQIFLAEMANRRGLWQKSVQLFEETARTFPKRRPEILRSTQYRQSVLNTFGILEGNRRLETLTHAQVMEQDGAAANPGPTDKKYAFVSGMPRAGTTALGNLLNLSSDVAIFTEIHNPYLVYAQDSFTQPILKSRIKNLPAAAPKNMLEKSQEVAIIGDKRPLLHYVLPQIFSEMSAKSVTVFHILRSVAQIAESYQTRAENPNDNWDPLRDLGNCIHELNVMHRFILDWDALGQMHAAHKLIYVDYNRVFSEFDYAMELFDKLGIVICDRLQRYVSHYQARSSLIAAGPRAVRSAVLKALQAQLDIPAAQAVSNLTGIDILAGLPLDATQMD